MKIGFTRQDALEGATYAVSAHLAEGRAAEILHNCFPHLKTLLVRDAVLGKEEPHFCGIAAMLTSHGYSLLPWDGTTAALLDRVAQSAPGTVALFTWGDLYAMLPDADALAAASAEGVTHLWWRSRPRDAFCLAPVGLRPVELSFTDPTLFDDAAWGDALPYAVRLGVLLDRHLFSLIYSSYDPVTLLARGCRLTEDLAREDTGNVRARLAFGAMMAQVIDRVTENEMTEAEALALGMLYEARLGARLGITTSRKLADLEGILSYHGYPRAVTASGEELMQAFRTLFGTRDTVTLTLPLTIGTCRTTDVPSATIERLLPTLAG